MQTNPHCIFLRALLGQCQNFTTRAEIKSALDRMTSVVKQCVADHPTEDGAHQNVKELPRAILRPHFDGDIRAFGCPRRR